MPQQVHQDTCSPLKALGAFSKTECQQQGRTGKRVSGKLYPVVLRIFTNDRRNSRGFQPENR